MEKKRSEAVHNERLKITFYSPLVTLLVTIGLFLGTQVIVSLIFGLFIYGAGWSSDRADEWYRGSAFAQLVFLLMTNIIILSFIAVLLKYKNLSFRLIGLKKPKFEDIWRALLGYAVYVICFIVLTATAKAILPSLNLDQEQFNFDAISKTPLNLVLLFISLVILPPLTEEIVCRGFLYTNLRSRLKYAYAAVITSIIFAVAHLQFGSGAPLLWVAAIDTFVLSLMLVYLREKSGSLAAPMLLHGFKNFVAFSILFLI